MYFSVFLFIFKVFYDKKHRSISKEHAIIEFRDKKEAFLKDLGSLNGTYINNKRISSGNYIELKDFDEICFGKEGTIYVFNYIEKNEKIVKENSKENREKRNEFNNKDYKISLVDKGGKYEENSNLTAEFQKNEGFIEENYREMEDYREKEVKTLNEALFLKEELIQKKENQIELLINETGSLKEELEKVSFLHY